MRSPSLKYSLIISSSVKLFLVKEGSKPNSIHLILKIWAQNVNHLLVSQTLPAQDTSRQMD